MWEKLWLNSLCLLHSMLMRKQIEDKCHRKHFSVPQIHPSGSLWIHDKEAEKQTYKPTATTVLGITHPRTSLPSLKKSVCLLVAGLSLDGDLPFMRSKTIAASYQDMLGCPWELSALWQTKLTHALHPWLPHVRPLTIVSRLGPGRSDQSTLSLAPFCL